MLAGEGLRPVFEKRELDGKLPRMTGHVPIYTFYELFQPSPFPLLQLDRVVVLYRLPADGTHQVVVCNVLPTKNLCQSPLGGPSEEIHLP